MVLAEGELEELGLDGAMVKLQAGMAREQQEVHHCS